MKKILLIVTMAVVMMSGASAQEIQSHFTINTRAWTTNYWTMLLYNAARDAVVHFAFDDMQEINAVVPNADLVFPIGMGKEGFTGPTDIYGPYHRAFSNPFKQLGDCGIGLDVSWTANVVGFYAGAYFKSQEICFKSDDKNLRGNYFQPRAGLVMGKNGKALEVGAFYDYVAGCTGSWDWLNSPNKDMLQSGWGLDFALSYTNHAKTRKNLLMFSMPLHNFINENYRGGMFKGWVRKVGYIMITHRVTF